MQVATVDQGVAAQRATATAPVPTDDSAFLAVLAAVKQAVEPDPDRANAPDTSDSGDAVTPIPQPDQPVAPLPPQLPPPPIAGDATPATQNADDGGGDSSVKIMSASSEPAQKTRTPAPPPPNPPPAVPQSDPVVARSAADDMQQTALRTTPSSMLMRSVIEAKSQPQRPPPSDTARSAPIAPETGGPPPKSAAMVPAMIAGFHARISAASADALRDERTPDEQQFGLRALSDPPAHLLRAGERAGIAAPDVARHVAAQLATAAPQRSGVTEIALNPEELGRVRMNMTTTDGAIQLHIIAERPETADLLRRHIDTLAQEFRAMGYGDLRFSFGDGGRPPPQHRQQDAAFDRPAADPCAPEQGQVLSFAPKAALDLRM